LFETRVHVKDAGLAIGNDYAFVEGFHEGTIEIFAFLCASGNEGNRIAGFDRLLELGVGGRWKIS
jgi:hypothetical protein